MKREFAVVGMVACLVVGGLAGWLIPAYIGGIQGPTLLGDIQSRGYMIVGTSADWPPFEYYNLTGTEEYEGFDIDLCNLIAADLGVTITWSDMAFESLISACETGLVDLLAAALFITPERVEVLDHSVPYIRTNEVVIAFENFTGTINVLEDLENYTVGVQTGTAEHYEIEDLIDAGYSITYFDYPSAFELIANLMAETFQVAFVDEPVFTVWSKTYLLKVFFTVPAEPTALFIRKNEPEFLAAINNVILTAYKDGTLDALVDKWFT